MIGWWGRRRRIRRDRQTLLILWACSALGGGGVAELMQVTGLDGALIHVVLAGLQRDGAVTRTWHGEEPNRRVFYATTPAGDEQAQNLAVELAHRWTTPAAGERR